jgi:hypothetical protein
MRLAGAALLLLLGGRNALESELVVLAVIVVPHIPSGGLVPDRHKEPLLLNLVGHVGHADRVLEPVNVVLGYRLAISGRHFARRLPPVEREPDGDPLLECDVADDDGALDQLCVRRQTDLLQLDIVGPEDLVWAVRERRGGGC